MFEKKGEIVVDGSRYSEDDLMAAIDAGAEDVSLDDDVFEVVTAPGGPHGGARGARGGGRASSSRPSWRCGRRRRDEVDEGDAGKLMRLIDTLEEHDDVQAVHANFDVDADVLERVAAS